MATFPTTAKFVDPSELKEILDQEKGSVAVVDVRSYDYKEGKIPGAYHYPSEDFVNDEAVDSYLSELRSQGKSKLVVHCTKSQQRGPSCAQRLIDRLSAAPSTEDSPEVLVLKGGFAAWQQAFAGMQPSLIAPLEPQAEGEKPTGDGQGDVHT